MKRRAIKVIIAVFAALACVFAFAACASESDNGNNNVNPDDSPSSLNGTYYLYKDGSYDESDFIKIDGESWSDKMGMKGFIELDGTSISLKYKSPAIAGLPDPAPVTYYDGIIGNGVFKEEAYMGIPLVNNNIKYYCMSGKTPSDLPNNGGNNPDNPNEDNPSSSVKTVALSANGGYCATSNISITVGSSMQNLPTPKRTGYNFAGWKDSGGKSYDSNSKMPNIDLTLIAQWVRTEKQYSDSYVTFTLATEGAKSISTQVTYSGDVDKFIYVELTSDDLGGSSKVGIRNNFNLSSVSDLKITKKNNYGWVWYEGHDNLFNTPNGAQRFTLNYGSNIQFLAVDDGSGVVLQTYLVDFYVKHDYNINLYSDVYAIYPYETVRVIEGDYFDVANSTTQVCDFVFDKHVYRVPIDDSYLLDYDYSKPVTQNWNLYQTYKEKKITPELNNGIIEGDIFVTPYVNGQQLPVPQKEGCDFIGWKLNNKYFTDKDGNSGVNYLSSSNGTQTLTASFEPKRFYWYNSDDELRTVVATPDITYRDSAKTEISSISYTYNGTMLNNSNTFIVGDNVTVTAEKDGYTFVGWYNGEETLSSNKNYTFTVPENEFTYTRRWTYYTLTTDRNITSGGSVTSYYEQKITAGNNVTITANTYSGYTFLGWYDGSTQLTDNLSYTFTMPEANITYTAKWTNCPVTIEKNIAAAGSIDMPETTSFGQSVTVTATTNSGYTWLGWYSGNTRLTTDTSYTFTLSDSSATYTAKWAEYKLRTNVNDTNAGSVTNYSEQRITAGQSVTVNATTNNGYTFVGWYDGTTRKTTELSYTFTMPSNNVSYTAKWCKVSVVSDDTTAGTVSSLNSTYKVGDKATVTATTNNGYTFVGWYDGTTRKTSNLSYTFTMPSTNITYTAKWTFYTLTLNKTEGGNVASVGGSTNTSCVIDFNLNGGSGTIASQTVTKEIGLTYPTVPTRNGYVFGGWYGNSACDGSPFDFSANVTSDTTLYAKWLSYYGSGTINYNGSKTLSVVSKNSSSAYYAFVPLVSGAISVYSTGTLDTYGYLYNSSKNELAHDDDSGDGNNFKITYNVTAGTLYYVRPCGYSSSGNTTVYVSGAAPNAGGKVAVNALASESTRKITAGQSVTVTATTNNGYTFVGWYDGATRKTLDLSYMFAMPTSNVTYTAKWCKVSVVSDDATAGTVSSLNSTYKVGDRVTVVATTNNGYTFVGWYNGTRELTKELSYTFTMPSANTTYTAKWIKVTVVSDNTTAGTVSSLNGTYKVGDSVTVMATTNGGYTWLGWYNGNTLLTSNTSYSFTMTASDATYTAKWTYYTVTTVNDNTDAGTITNYNAQKITAGQSATVTATTNSGYTFVGWYNGTKELTKDLSYTFTMPSANVTYTAKWTYYTVTTVNDNTSAGTITSYNGQKITAGQQVTIKATPKRGYTFSGWYDGSIKKSTDLGYTFTMPSRNVTYTAKWTYFTFTTDRNDTSAGTVSNYNQTKVTVGQSTTIRATTNNGYIWLGWYNGNELLTNSTSYTFTMPASNVTYTAKWKIDDDLNCFTYEQTTEGFRITGVKDKTITSVTIPSCVIEIGYNAFEGCSNLTSIEIPDSVTSIESSIFYNCSGLTSITVQNGNTKYHGDSNCLIETESKTLIAGCKNSVIPTNGSVARVGHYAFKGCSGLTSITMPNSVKSIGDGAFEGCNNLTSVTIGINVTSIGERAFYGCGKLTSITIPDGVTSIGTYAFHDCSSLQYKEYNDAKYLGNSENPYFALIKATDIYISSCYIHDNTKVIACGAFYGCANLQYNQYDNAKYIGSSGGNRYFALIEDVGSTITSCMISDSTKIIVDKAFFMCSKLKSITIPDSVISVGDQAFESCMDLKRITIGTGVTSIGSFTFNNCISLTSITIPNSVTRIGRYAFNGCSSLASITIPNSVTSIEDSAFYRCDSLSSVTFETTSGWWYTGSAASTNGTSLSSSDLSNPSTAATYLKYTYCSKYWKRT